MLSKKKMLFKEESYLICKSSSEQNTKKKTKEVKLFSIYFLFFVDFIYPHTPKKGTSIF